MAIDYDEFMKTLVTDKIVDMSATSVALCLSALTSLQKRWNWEQSSQPVSDVLWDDIDAMVSLANEELMASLVGMILPHAMATISAFKMLPCDGGVYNKSDYPKLYDVLDAVYIVSGTQFRVPDMRDRVPVGSGNNYSLDDSGGVDSVVLTTAQMPAHDHSYQQYTFGVDIESVGVPDPTGVGQPTLPQTTGSAGGSEAHENRMPYRAVKWAIVAS